VDGLSLRHGPFIPIQIGPGDHPKVTRLASDPWSLVRHAPTSEPRSLPGQVPTEGNSLITHDCRGCVIRSRARIRDTQGCRKSPAPSVGAARPLTTPGRRRAPGR
jgi:hypothetical protein